MVIEFKRKRVSWLWFGYGLVWSGLVYGKQDMKGMDWKEKKIQDVKENLILRF